MIGEHIDELNLSTCSLTDAKVAQIGLHEMDVKEIDLSHNNQITAVGWAIIGKALQEKQVDELNVYGRRLSDVEVAQIDFHQIDMESLITDLAN